MPRAETRQVETVASRAGALEYRIERRGGQLRVSLAGILDGEGLGELQRRVIRHLPGRGGSVALDGSRLRHLDYRCVPALVAWSRHLALYRHRLELVAWNEYLGAILAMEDWGCELPRDRASRTAADRRAAAAR